MTTKRAHKTTDLQHKYDAVRSVLNKTKTTKQVAEELRVTTNTVNEWLRKTYKHQRPILPTKLYKRHTADGPRCYS